MKIHRFLRFRVTTLALLPAVAALVVQQAAGHAQESPYSYFFEGRLVVLEASPDLVAVRADAPEPPAVEGASWRRDRLSERGALRDTGFVLYRLGADAAKNTEVKAPRRSATALARDAGVALQPVFELGGAVKIPSDEVIVAFAAETDFVAAESALGARGDLGVLGLRPLMKNTFVVTISGADDGRAFAVSRDLSLIPGVAYAEPNFVVVMNPAPPVIRPGAFVPNLGPATELQRARQAPPSWRSRFRGDVEVAGSPALPERSAPAVRTAGLEPAPLRDLRGQRAGLDPAGRPPAQIHDVSGRGGRPFGVHVG